MLATGEAPTASALTNCSADTSIDGEEEAFLGLINQYRGENGVGLLVLSATLSQAAAWKSQHMADNDYFAHDDTPIGRTWVQRLRDCDYTYNTWLGENLAAGNAGADRAFEEWRNSPSHNANMLSEQFMAIGIGRAFNGASQYGWYWTMEFGGYVDAAPPTPTPATQLPEDTDNDGCTDTQESGPDAALGGQRDYLNYWDFFDPNLDGSVSLLDFLAILRHFGAVGDPSAVDPDGLEPPIGDYWVLADRGGQSPGGDPWDELPANGSIGMTDFLSLLRQFGHTCA